MTQPSRPARIIRKIGNSTRPARLLARRHELPVALPQATKPKRALFRRVARALSWLLVALFVVLGGFRIAAAMRETKGAADLAPRAGQLIDTGHGRMFLQDAGPRNAMPIVLIHGTAAWSEFWRGTMDHLVARGHRVIAVDLPPFGFSDRPGPNGYSREMQAKRIDGALAALGVQQAVLVGHSFGAGATTETVMRYSKRVSGLVLVAAALGLPEDGATPSPPPDALTTFLDLPVLPEMLVASTATNPLLTRQLLGTMVARKEAATPELARILQQPMTRQNTTKDFVGWAKAFITPDLTALSGDPRAYARIQVPTQIIWGVDDSLTPLPQGQRLARLIPGANLTVLPKVGHIPQIEDPQVFRAALDAALKSLLK